MKGDVFQDSVIEVCISPNGLEEIPPQGPSTWMSSLISVEGFLEQRDIPSTAWIQTQLWARRPAPWSILN